jgi:hypothetical protein
LATTPRKNGQALGSACFGDQITEEHLEPKDFFLELNLTKETLEFTDISGTGVANRGFDQNDIFLGALGYLRHWRRCGKSTPPSVHLRCFG